MEKETAVMRIPQPQAFALIPTTLGEAMEMAKLIVGTELCPERYRGKAAEAIVAYEYGRSLGLSWLQALRSVAVIKGIPTLYGDAVPAVIYGSGQVERFHEYYEGRPFEDDYRAVCIMRRKGMPDDVVQVFSVLDAKTAKLWQKRGRNGEETPWITYPGRMLKMRARGFAARDTFADCLAGLILFEEAQDYPELEDGNTITVQAEKVEEADPLEPIPEGMRENVGKGFETLNMGNGPRIAKIREFMSGQGTPEEQAQRLLDWLRDEYSRRKTGKPRPQQNGKAAVPAAPVVAPPVDHPVTSTTDNGPAAAGAPGAAPTPTAPVLSEITPQPSPATATMPPASAIFPQVPKSESAMQAVEF